MSHSDGLAVNSYHVGKREDARCNKQRLRVSVTGSICLFIFYTG